MSFLPRIIVRGKLQQESILSGWHAYAMPYALHKQSLSMFASNMPSTRLSVTMY